MTSAGWIEKKERWLCRVFGLMVHRLEVYWVYRLLFVCLISSWHRIPWFAYFEPTLLYQKNLFLVFSFFHSRREKQCSWKDFATSFRSRPLLVPGTLGLHEEEEGRKEKGDRGKQLVDILLWRIDGLIQAREVAVHKKNVAVTGHSMNSYHSQLDHPSLSWLECYP